MCSSEVLEPVVDPILEAGDAILQATGITKPDQGGSGFKKGPKPGASEAPEVPQGPSTDPKQIADIRSAGDEARRRALLRIGRSSTKKTGSLGIPGDPFVATRKLLGG